MKIVVIGGTGLIGSKVVAKLKQQGHEVIAASPNTGVNTITGEGLDEALAGARGELGRARAEAAAAREKSERQEAELADLEELARQADQSARAAEGTVSEIEPRLAGVSAFDLCLAVTPAGWSARQGQSQR